LECRRKCLTQGISGSGWQVFVYLEALLELGLASACDYLEYLSVLLKERTNPECVSYPQKISDVSGLCKHRLRWLSAASRYGTVQGLLLPQHNFFFFKVAHISVPQRNLYSLLLVF
jgi:hypothetical protein